MSWEETVYHQTNTADTRKPPKSIRSGQFAIFELDSLHSAGFTSVREAPVDQSGTSIMINISD